MMDNGIGCDLVSMARPPLHTVPLFVTRSRQYGGAPAWTRSQQVLSVPQFGSGQLNSSGLAGADTTYGSDDMPGWTQRQSWPSLSQSLLLDEPAARAARKPSSLVRSRPDMDMTRKH